MAIGDRAEHRDLRRHRKLDLAVDRAEALAHGWYRSARLTRDSRERRIFAVTKRRNPLLIRRETGHEIGHEADPPRRELFDDIFRVVRHLAGQLVGGERLARRARPVADLFERGATHEAV